ncbi:MAG: CRISPR-associated endonuclease Cas1 [Candidatus Edwardsbacteria bacterium]|nr:CRISPR-associated endonuclease Cas1 [Candidatus Edwardsbacteria bacterium]
MPTLYLLEQNSRLSKTSKRLVVERDGVPAQEIPEFKVDRAFIFGNVQVTTQALRFLLTEGADVCFFTMAGKLCGKLVPAEGKNVFLRMKQYDAFKDEPFKLSLAKSVAAGKIANCRAALQKHGRNHPEAVLEPEIARLGELLDDVPRKTQLSSLLGVEGMAAKVYFQGFARCLRKSFSFDGRNRRPPRDPVNSLLSLTYALLTAEMFSITSAIGLDPYVGFLHSLDYGRPSLALDLIEEFRPVIADRLTLELVNREMLAETDFEYERTEEGDVLKVLLNAEGKKTYFTQYEKRMNAVVATDGGEAGYRRVFESQARQMAAAIERRGEYRPFQLR